MRRAVAQFLRFLATERNASELTVKAYREDLFGLIEYLEDVQGDTPDPAKLTPQDLRQYQAALQQAGYARSGAPRRRRPAYMRAMTSTDPLTRTPFK